jgi:ADP-heptose:LPS heptosyltransferase
VTPGPEAASDAVDRPLLLSYRALGLGDLLTAVPALRALRSAFPHHRHVLATSGWLAPLVATIDAVDVHAPVEELAPLPPSVAGADVAVNLHGSGPRSHQVLLAAQPRRLIAFAHLEVARTEGAPAWRPEEHEIVRWCRLLAEYGLSTDPSDLDLAPPPGPLPEDVRGATVIHPGAKSVARRWPTDRFAAVARDEARRGHHVVVTGSDAERPLADAVAAGAGLPASRVLAGRLQLDGLARVVAAADRVVCGDTGVAHLATTYGTPSVVLFGPMSPRRWGPPADRASRHRVLWAGRRGDPLADTVDPGLLEIEVGDVLGEIAALDRGRGRARVAS